MGLAASQARFLELTSRKSNIEFQGQQINQQRLLLANESSGLYQRQLSLQPPVPPTSSKANYMKPAYTFYDAASDTTKTIKFTFDSNDNVVGATINYNIYETTGVATQKYINVHTGVATGSSDSLSHGVPTSFATDIGFDQGSGRLSKLNLSIWDDTSGTQITSNYTGSDITYAPEFDSDAYNNDMNKYEYQKSVYDCELEKLNAQTAGVQNRDRTLELKMKQLDTEHNAIAMELDSIQKVIKANMDSSFKTFAV